MSKNKTGTRALVFSRRFRLDENGNRVYIEDLQSHNEEPDALATLEAYNRALMKQQEQKPREEED